MTKPPQTSRRLPLTVSLTYFFVYSIWILLSDQLVHRLASELAFDPMTLRNWQTGKAWASAAVTAVLLYGLLQRHFNRLEATEGALRQRERFLHQMMAGNPDGLLVLDAEGTLREVNAAGRIMMGLATDGDPGEKSLVNAVMPVYREALARVLQSAAQGQEQAMEFEALDAGGRRHWVAFRAVPLRVDEAAVPLVLASAREISDYKSAVAKVDRINRLYSVLSEVNQAIVRIRDRDELFLAVCRILVEQGRFRMAWIGRVNLAEGVVDPICHWGHEDHYLKELQIPVGVGERAMGPTGLAVREGSFQICNDIAADPRMQPWREAALLREYRSSAAFPIHSHGGVAWVLCIYAEDAGFFDELHVDLLAGLSMDIAFALSVILQEQQRRQAELALAEEKERLDVTLQSIDDGVITADTGGHVVLMNRVAVQLTGWDQAEACGRPLGEVFRVINSKTRDAIGTPVPQVLKRRAPIELAQNVALMSRDGSERLIAESAAPMRNADGAINGVVLVFRDISEKAKLEDELLKTRKLESLGVLAGGIAHDFNNLLTAIMGSVSLARAFVEGHERVHRRLEEAERACVQARELTQQLLTFAKGGVPVKSAASIGEIIKETANFATVGGRTRTVYELPDNLWSVEVDIGQISQVFGNLIINAAQAMPNGGVITIRGTNVAAGPELPLPLPPGPYVRIDVADQGLGIAPEHLSRIFDPYFTTKPDGNGLGLASAYAIIKKHDGYIDVRSTLGAGTTFMVYLPASVLERQIKSAVDDKVTAGRGAILVMDDAQSIRELIGEMLDYLGYSVAFARDGEEAKRQYEAALAAGRRFDAVIMDLTIPGGMGGKEAVVQLLAIDPEARVIVSSGYSNDPIMSNYRQYGFSAVIAKPYRLAELGKVLDGVLGEA